MSPALAPSPSPADATRITALLGDLAQRLIEVLDRETALVRAMRVKEIGPLQAQKTELTAQYQTMFKTLTTTYEGKLLPPEIKEQLALTGQRLSAAVIENDLMLRVGKTATERLIGSIVNAVREQKKSITAYAPNNVVPRRSFMTSSAVDRRL
jgi:hypothetical protein